MNTNPKAKRILCFGDSNTYGAIPGTDLRYSADIRWPGKLQSILGSDYEIVEEGLKGRTTNVDDPAPGYEDKNGLDYLFPCIRSQVPLDFVVLMLGTNDFKKVYNRSALDVAEANRLLIQAIREHGDSGANMIKIILMSPAHILDSVEIKKPHFSGSPKKSRLLAKELEKVAREENCEFIDIAEFANVSEVDGLHLTEESHSLVAEKLSQVIL